MIAALVFVAALQGAPPAIFVETIADIREEARERGHDEATLARLDGADYLPDVAAKLDAQPEFTLDPTDYIRRLVSEERVALARKAYLNRAKLLRAIEARFGVEGGVLIAIWGVESGFGAVKGAYDPFSALATLAAGTRRAAFGREQLLALLEIVDRGLAPAGPLHASWAGAMGQTQFIPTTFLRSARDFDGDGDRDIWNDAGDALASAAGLLADEGWRRGAPVLVEMRLDPAADWPSRRLSPTEWAAAGWRPLSGGTVQERFAEEERLELVAPAGAGGPVFLGGANYRALLAYNRSELYATAIALIARGARGESPAPQTPWPAPQTPLSRGEIERLQAWLAALGHGPIAADGVAGPRTRAAVRRFQKASGLAPDGRVGRGVYEAAAAAAARL